MTKRKILFATIAGISLIVFFLEVKKKFSEFERKSHVYIYDCKILNADRVLIFSADSELCAFLNDGSYISENGTTETDLRISRVSAHDTLLWSKSLVHHHTISLSRDQKLVYVLSAEIKKWRNKAARFDTIVALDVETGEKIYSWSIFDIKELLEKEHGSPVPAPVDTDPDHQYIPFAHYDIEFSHFNSINIVPDNFVNSSEIELIVNTGRGIELFFSRDLNLIAQYKVDSLWAANSHDAQITPNGELLIYKNWEENYPGASLEKYDLEKKKKIWQYSKNPDGTSFNSRIYGSVQLLDDGGLLYSDMNKGGHFVEVDKEGSKVVDYYSSEKDPRTHLPLTFIKVRKLSYSKLSRKIQNLLDVDLNKFWASGIYKKLL